MQNKHALVLNELINLPSFRLQGISFSDDHILIFECYFNFYGKYFLVIDQKVLSQSIYLSQSKPIGQKSSHPLVQATKKYCLGKTVDIFASAEKLILNSGKNNILIDLSKKIRVGLFVDGKLMASLGSSKGLILPAESNREKLVNSFAITNNELEAARHQKLINQAYLTNAIKNSQKILNKKKLLEARILEDLEKCQNIITREHEALLLQGNYNLLKKGQEYIILTDYFSKDQKPVKIFLDKNKSPKENIEQKFNWIKKAKRGITAIEPRLNEIREEIENLSKKLVMVKNTDPSVIVFQKDFIPKKAKEKERLPYNKYLSKDGLEILVGRSAKDSDLLSLKIAKGNNWWFHAKDFPGAHIVVRYEKDDLPPDTFIEAAMLAIYFSKAKQNTKAEVIYTRAKYLKKTKGLKPGSLLITQEKSRLIELNEEKLKSLLKK